MAQLATPIPENEAHLFTTYAYYIQVIPRFPHINTLLVDFTTKHPSYANHFQAELVRTTTARRNLKILCLEASFKLDNFMKRGRRFLWVEMGQWKGSRRAECGMRA
jgi:hypothetical protein